MLRTGLLIRAACREDFKRQDDRGLSVVVVMLVVGKEDEEEEDEEGGNAPRLPARPRMGDRGEGSSALLASAKTRLLVLVLGAMRGATVLARVSDAWQALMSPRGGILFESVHACRGKESVSKG
jgi:hypothetical protein